MSEDSITIKYSLTKEDLICSLCLDELTLPIIQCANGNHFLLASAGQSLLKSEVKAKDQGLQAAKERGLQVTKESLFEIL